MTIAAALGTPQDNGAFGAIFKGTCPVNGVLALKRLNISCQDHKEAMVSTLP